MGESLRDKIRGYQDRTEEVVPTPEWEPVGVPKVLVRSLSAKERLGVSRAVAAEETDDNLFWCQMVAAACYDPDSGEKAFDDGDVGWLADKLAGPIQRIAEKAMELSGLLEAQAEDAVATFPVVDGAERPATEPEV